MTHVAPITHLGRGMGSLHSTSTLRDVKDTRKWQSCLKLVMGNWNITSLTWNERALVLAVTLKNKLKLSRIFSWNLLDIRNVSAHVFSYAGKCKYLWMVITSDWRQKKGIDTWIGKANAVLCAKFIALWLQNGNFEISQSCGLLFRSSTMAMNHVHQPKEC